MGKEKAKPRLTNKNKVFIEEYITNGFNATQAAISAGYSERAARACSSRLLTKANVKEEVRRRIDEKCMTADEVLMGLAEIARCSMADMMQDEWPYLVELKKVKQKGRLVKKLKRRGTDFEVELHDRHKALIDIGKVHNLFTDLKIDGTVNLVWDRTVETKK